MRLLERLSDGDLRLTENLLDEDILQYPYAILSHRWGQKNEEVTYKDIENGSGQDKAGYKKIEFCAKQAEKDGLNYFWVDSCCIKRSSDPELSEAINSMYRWYSCAARCYVYLSDVSTMKRSREAKIAQNTLEKSFGTIEWFSRGWTLQELLAPMIVEFFDRDGGRLGDKKSLESQIVEITGINPKAIQGSPLSHFSVYERFSWAKNRITTRGEDAAYSLFGIFGVYMPLIYGEGKENAIMRLKKEIAEKNAISAFNLYGPLGYSFHSTATPGAGDQVPADGRETRNQIQSTTPNQQALNIPLRPQTPPNGGLFSQSIQNQTWRTVNSLVDRTRYAIMVDDLPLHQHLAHIYREVGKTQAKLQQLTMILEASEFSRGDQARMSSNEISQDDKQAAEPHSIDQWPTSTDSDVSDIFFKCLSRYSKDSSDGALDRSNALFSGSLDYVFETSTRSFPDQYTVVSSFTEAVTVVSITELEYTNTRKLIEVSLLYSETPRKCRRVIVLAAIAPASSDSVISRISSPTVWQQVISTLPGNMQSQFQKVLKGKPLLETVTRTSMSITEYASGEFTVDETKLGFTEDLKEVRACNEETFLEDIKDIGCPQILERYAAQRSRAPHPHNRIVQVGSQCHLEHHFPFPETRLSDTDAAGDFFEKVKELQSLQACSGVARLGGVLLDDTGKHLKSYLCEWPSLGNVAVTLDMARARGERIAWEIREAWVKQIVTAMCDVHAHGTVIGYLRPSFIGIRADGSVVLMALKCPGRRTVNAVGYLAPELRTQPYNTPAPEEMTFRTDVFNLGLILWLIAEHQGTAIGSIFCRKHACTRVPLSSCTAEHVNPIELPSCTSPDVPKYMDAVISHCRKIDPRARWPARQLLQCLPDKRPPPHMADLLTKYAETESGICEAHTKCSNCAEPTSSLHYNCNICQLGDFDICQKCFFEGIRCPGRGHQLTKRVLQNGNIVMAP